MIYAIISLLGFAFDSILMAPLYRRLPGMLAVGLRGTALGLSMLPLLFLGDLGDVLKIGPYLPLLLIAAISATIGNFGWSQVIQYFPVGISSGLVVALQVVFVSLFGSLFLQDSLGLKSLIFILLIIANNFAVASGKHTSSHSLKNNHLVGLLFALLQGCGVGLGFVLMSKVSRGLSPLVAAWGWEFLIGIVAMSIYWVQLKLKFSVGNKFSWGEYGQALLRSAPTIGGTGGYALAVTTLPAAIVSAVVSTQVIVTGLLGALLYREHLSLRTWLHLGLAVLLVVGLKILS